MGRAGKSRNKINVESCLDLLLEIVKIQKKHTSARRAYDLADVIEANDLRNPDPIVFDKEVTKRVMINTNDKLYKKELEFKEKCLPE